MRRCCCGLLLALLAAVQPVGAEPRVIERPISDAEGVVAVYNSPARAGGADRLILAAWGDGRVVWSGDALHGGPPYRAASIDPAAVKALLAGAASDGLLDQPALARAYYGPDSQYTVVALRSSTGAVTMRTWHELYEANGKSVATHGGLTPLAGRPRMTVLSQEPADYLFFRLAWSDLRRRTAALIPNDGTEGMPVDGELSIRAGKAVWLERVSDPPSP